MSNESDDTDPTASFEDPEFERLTLTIEVEEALDEIETAVKGLHATATDVGVKVRTTDGRLVAVVQEPGGAANAGSVFQYRTEPASGLATRKAGKLQQALETFATDAESVPSQ